MGVSMLSRAKILRRLSKDCARLDMWTGKTWSWKHGFTGGPGGVLDQYAREFIALKCSVIFASNPYAIRAVLKATSTIPTVGIDLESDPVASGLAKSLARPGGNFTGFFSGYSRTGGQTNRIAEGGRTRCLASSRALGRNDWGNSIPCNRDGC